jgi:hypothetical protein
MSFFSPRLFAKRACSFRWVLILAVLIPANNSFAQTLPVVHWINDSGQDGYTLLNSTSNFITSFKATNDVHVKLITGSVNSIFQEAFTVGTNVNNPAFLTNFVGLAGNGTGDGGLSHLKCLETELGGNVVLQVDFAVPLTPGDRMVIADADNGEKYGIQAFFAGQSLNLSGWSFTNCSGETSQMPDTNWPAWDGNAGTLTASMTSSFTEPLAVLTPDQSVDRVIITRFNQGGGSMAFQFVNVSTTIGQPVLKIQSAGTNAVLSWPASFPNYSLYTATNLAPPAPWTLVGQPTLISSQLVVTNATAVKTRFYRLQHQ